MKLIKFILIFFCIVIISCKKNTKETTFKQVNDSITYENKNANNPKELENNKSIDIDVLGLKIGETMPDKIEGYKLIKSLKIVEEGGEEPIVKVIENGDEIFQLSYAYDNVNEKFTNKIDEILIFSNKFKTKENIGVNSTIEDFASIYSKHYIWYTYISNNYIIENENKNIQFLLDETNYVGKKDLYESDKIELTKDDFVKKSRIKAIRIY